MVEILMNEPTAANRLVYFKLVGTDGITPAANEAGGQPQILINGGSWTSIGIGVLTNPGGAVTGANPEGLYHAVLDPSVITTPKNRIETRYKSSTTAECPGDSVVIVASDSVAEAAAFARIGSATIETTSIVLPNKNLKLIAGMSYYEADRGRGIKYTDADSVWADLTGATIRFTVIGSGIWIAGRVLSNPSGPATIIVELSEADTLAIGADVPREGQRTFLFEAVLSNLDKVDLLTGYISVAKGS